MTPQQYRVETWLTTGEWVYDMTLCSPGGDLCEVGPAVCSPGPAARGTELPSYRHPPRDAAGRTVSQHSLDYPNWRSFGTVKCWEHWNVLTFRNPINIYFKCTTCMHSEIIYGLIYRCVLLAA